MLVTSQLLFSYLREFWPALLEMFRISQRQSERRLADHWKHLPDTVLIDVFLLLQDSDRSALGQVCKRFNQLFKSARLWRRREFDLTCMSVADEERMLGFGRNHAAHLRHLILSCRHPSYHTCTRFQKTLTTFLNFLFSKTELLEFSMEHLEFECYWRYSISRDRLLTSLKRFVRTQRKLLLFDMTRALFSADEGCELIQLLGKSSGQTLQELYIEELFVRSSRIFRNPIYLESVAKFKSLISLHISYNAISENTLVIIARNCGETLEHLKIKVHKHTFRQHTISRYVWKDIAKMCPRLEVFIEFLCVGNNVELLRILCPSIPLIDLDIDSGYNHEQHTWRLSNTLEYVSDTYSKSLETLCLELDNPSENIDGALRYLVRKCIFLTSLEINAHLSVSLMEDICILQSNDKIFLTKCHIIACNVTQEDYSRMKRLRQEYVEQFASQGCDFKLRTDYLMDMNEEYGIAALVDFEDDDDLINILQV
ncbi:unnamed protein product [Owenia fusiformis]|uniref:Uncharacterized protein n=1 Tax=Owenia fusiformis TaxID=6347 RepID=A0A8J1TM68_OWEFU|nr:unnamed protein product [Owenia fusiformis]